MKVAAAAAGGKSAVGIAPLLRKDKTATDVYDLLFGLSFLEPRYSLLFQDTQNPAINGHVVNVLEGTMPAFNNRRIKYHTVAR
jgi:hypothetical protein